MRVNFFHHLNILNPHYSLFLHVVFYIFNFVNAIENYVLCCDKNLLFSISANFFHRVYIFNPHLFIAIYNNVDLKYSSLYV